MKKLVLWTVICSLSFFIANLAQAQESSDAATVKPATQILVHVMPWFEADAEKEKWGWHWTMNRVDPNVFDSNGSNGRRKIAAHYSPEIGPYDSADDAVLEYQLLLMKLAGIDGVIVDWYGRTDHFDYALLHANTVKLFEYTQRFGLKFAVCYEDQTIPKLVTGGKVDSSEAVDHAVGEIKWLKENWFSQDNYLQLDGLPVLLSFGNEGLTDPQWDQVIQSLGFKVQYFSEHHRRDCAVGAFDWPVPNQSKTTETFLRDSKQWKHLIPVAFPGFNDFYQQAGVSKEWRQIPDEAGETFRKTLRQALVVKSPVVQIATWNDWGEGTMIEPSVEFGDRDLQVIQKLRLELVDPNFQYSAEDLKLPGRLLAFRRSKQPVDIQKLDAIGALIAEGNTTAARQQLDAVAHDKRASATDYKVEKGIAYRDDERIEKLQTDYMKKRCKLDFYYPADKKEFATVVWFHAGGMKGGNRFFPAGLKGQGIGIIAVDYRLSPKVTSPAYIEDAAAAVAWAFDNVRQRGGSPKKIFVAGHSAGGYLTSMVGMDKRWLEPHGIDCDTIAGLISYSGHSITHMTVRAERGISDKTPVVDEMAPLFHVRDDGPPVLLLSGDREKEMLGRYEETAYFWRMLKVAGHADVDLIELKGKDHGGMVKAGHAEALRFIGRIVGEIDDH